MATLTWVGSCWLMPRTLGGSFFRFFFTGFCPVAAPPAAAAGGTNRFAPCSWKGAAA